VISWDAYFKTAKLFTILLFIMAEHSIKFWGVRGSFPTPDRDKIEVGGHSSCVEVRTANNELIVFDMGTGFVPLGNALMKEENGPKTAHVFISHFHWDHIIGYLGFVPFFSNDFTCNIYGKKDKLTIEEIFDHLHHNTFWPVEIPMYQAKLQLLTFPEEGVQVSDTVKVKAMLHGHPNGANTYRLEIGEKIIVYCTDIEHPDDHLNPNVIDIARGADVLIKDAQFTDEELSAHKGWGHSSWQQCTEVAKEAGVKQLILYHHSPANDDAAIREIEKNAQAIFKNTIAARSGLEINLPA
jgi:phosphoribosyl 1,2-cyclic phosphodiesterase